MRRILEALVGYGIFIPIVSFAANMENKVSPNSVVAPTAAAGEEYYVNIREGTRIGWYSLRREANGYRFKFLDTKHNERQGSLPSSDALFIQAKFLALPVVVSSKTTRSCARRHVQISITKNGQRQERDRCLKELGAEETELLSILERATTRLQ